MTQIKGIDVSAWQGDIDWAKVKADGVHFAFIKATDGNSYGKTDYFKTQAPLADEAGIHVGAYHFARFSSVSDAVAEANYFLSIVKGFKLEYPLVLDLEVNNSYLDKKTLTDAAIAFLETIEGAGHHAMLYTYDYFLDNCLDETRLSNYALWIANYGSQPKNRADIWQYTDKGVVNGIVGTVDMDWAYKDFSVNLSGIIGYVTATVTDLNVRDKADISGNIVGQIHKTDGAYKSYALSYGWYNVGSGWVSGNYVTFKSV